MEAQNIFDLQGKVALVTGSYRGLGRAIAEGFAGAGATVVINGRNRQGVEATVAELSGLGYAAVGAPFDLIDEVEVDRAMRLVEERYGAPDILCNNAGVIRRAPLLEMESQTWREVIETNLTGAFLMAKRLVPGMIQKGGGKIINIASVLAEAARETVSSYASAKAGLRMLTQEMATEWGRHNIQANAIGPGFFATEMTEPLQNNETFDSWLKGRVPAGRWGDPAELVGPALFLASRASDFVNGQTLYVDGGLLARM